MLLHKLLKYPHQLQMNKKIETYYYFFNVSSPEMGDYSSYCIICLWMSLWLIVQTAIKTKHQISNFTIIFRESVKNFRTVVNL